MIFRKNSVISIFLLLTISFYFIQAVYARADKISVMSYNVENLFDTLHDNGKEDFTYLPLQFKKSSPEVQQYCSRIEQSSWRRQCYELDWNQEMLGKKIRQIARVIRSINGGQGPDILVLQEVENLNSLRLLRDIGLQGRNYQEAVIIEGEDERGVDVAILSKFPLASSPKHHKIDLSPAYPAGEPIRKTREILEATFNINGSNITILANHWSSQGNNDKTREIAAHVLYDVAKNIEWPIIAAGDFNTLADDRPHGINLWLMNPEKELSFYDAETMKYPHADPQRGSNWYRGTWSSLDKIFFLTQTTFPTCKSANKCIKVAWDSFRFVKEKFMLRDLWWENWNTGERNLYKDIPWRFNDRTGEGYSDHFPLIVNFTTN